MGKGGKRSGGEKANKGNVNDDMDNEQVLQAVVLADSFTKTFRPVTLDQPKVLLPLVNVPMLEYTLEFLANNSVDEVYVFCSAHSDQVSRLCARFATENCITRPPRVTNIDSKTKTSLTT
jgi:translation initiation factor eIF-2B subunit epsilon